MDIVSKFAREGAQSELLCADDIVVMSETIERLANMFYKWKVDFDSKFEC